MSMTLAVLEQYEGFRLGDGEVFLKKSNGWTRDMAEEVVDAIADVGRVEYARGKEDGDAYEEGYADAKAEFDTSV